MAMSVLLSVLMREPCAGRRPRGAAPGTGKRISASQTQGSAHTASALPHGCALLAARGSRIAYLGRLVQRRCVGVGVVCAGGHLVRRVVALGEVAGDGDGGCHC